MHSREMQSTPVSCNRRRFLKSAALGGAGLVAGAVGVNAMTPWVWPGRVPLESNPSFWARSQAPPNAPLKKDLTVDVAFIGGLEVLTRYMAKELGPRSIRANAVSPGAIRTDLGDGLNAEFVALLACQTTLGRVGEPDDVGRVIDSLLSDDNGWINAQSIEVPVATLSEVAYTLIGCR
jgi:NAD(P)-dependent dehydrogenase (short-subunit alcohol dehydrogenase family)